MAPGNITVTLKLAHIPDGLSFSITDIKPVKPNDDWYTYSVCLLSPPSAFFRTTDSS